MERDIEIKYRQYFQTNSLYIYIKLNLHYLLKDISKFNHELFVWIALGIVPYNRLFEIAKSNNELLTLETFGILAKISLFDKCNVDSDGKLNKQSGIVPVMDSIKGGKL